MHKPRRNTNRQRLGQLPGAASSKQRKKHKIMKQLVLPERPMLLHHLPKHVVLVARHAKPYILALPFNWP